METIERFKGINKGPMRSFEKKRYGDITLYMLSNGIGIFWTLNNLVENKVYKKGEYAFDFEFKVIERSHDNNCVIIKKKLQIKCCKIVIFT